MVLGVLGLAGVAQADPCNIDPRTLLTCVLGVDAGELQVPAAGHQPEMQWAGLIVVLLASAVAVWVIARLGLWRLPRERPGTGPLSAQAGDLMTPGQLLLGGLGLWFVMQLGGAAALALAGGAVESDATESTRATAIGLLGMYLCGGVATALVLTLGPRVRHQIGLRMSVRDVAIGAGWLALAVPILLLLGVLLAALATVLQGEPPDPTAHDTLAMLQLEEDGAWRIAVMLLVSLGAPVFEEITYRGFIQSAVRAAAGATHGGTWWAIVLTSVVFTMIHMGEVAWYALPVLTCLSVCLGLAFERSGRLGVPIAIHAFFNVSQLAYSLT